LDQFTYIPGGAGPAAVNLLSAANFTILAETTITDVPSSPIVGNIGLSPATGAGIGVTCAEMMTGTIFEVNADYVGGVGGTTCAAPGTVGSGANKTLVDTAVGDMLTAYNAAAGMTNPTATELGAGNISGMTLPSGLYKWGTSVNINSNVYLNGSSTAVWVFQISGDLTVASGAQVILEGGALAKNVFWQVGGPTGATLGTTSVFNGTILSAKQVVLTTGAILNGRALAQTQVVLDHNPVSIPSGVTAFPVVAIVSPTSGSTSGGTSVTITGVGFTSTTVVNFGANPATAFTVSSDTSIAATSPAGSAGAVDITVTAPGGTSATSSTDQFTYIVPAVVYSGGGGGGGGSSGGISVPIYTVTIDGGATTTVSGAASVSGATYASQMQLLNSLIAEFQAVLRQAQVQGMTLTPAETAYLNMSTVPTPSAITRDLTVGLRGSDVSMLQEFLISQAKGPAASALSAAGATGYFGQLTQTALAEYQAAVGVKPPSGYFGPIMRAYLKGIGF
jgi:hypothetical protein